MANKFCIARSAHITKNHPCSSCNSRTSECKLSCPQLAEYEEKRLQNDRERKKNMLWQNLMQFLQWPKMS